MSNKPKTLIEEAPVRLEDRARFQKPIPGTPDGREVVSSVPVAPPIGWKKQPSLIEQIRSMVRSERLAEEARRAGFETAEEADDFEVGDDYDPTSPYEHDFDPPSPVPSSPEDRPEAQGVVGGGRGGEGEGGDPSPPLDPSPEPAAAPQQVPRSPAAGSASPRPAPRRA